MQFGTQTSRVGGHKLKRLVSLALLALLAFPASALPPAESSSPVVGRLLAPEESRVVVRRESCRCGADGTQLALLTVGTKGLHNGEPHFHPLATLAFDPTLSPPDQQPGEADLGQWMALWVFGPSAAGWRRTLRSLLPLPVGVPRTSAKTLEGLDERLEEIRETPEEADLQVPGPAVHLANLDHSSPARGVWGGLRRGLSWAGALNPVQLVFRSYLVRRKDRRERNFQRSYLALQWLLDVEYTGEEEAAWLKTINDLRFHLLRNRSFFGRWVQHSDSLELVYNYESDVRRQLGKTSSWLQSAANEHALGYQPIYRYTEHGAAFPLGGVLYYDPQLGLETDPGWWSVANPFDLSYNPHTDPRVQQLASAHPDEVIPLAVYTFQTHLALRPIIAIDFFAPGNPQSRESTQQLMVLLKNWLAITTGSFSLERIPYRAIAWAANKKGFTRLVDKSSRLGVEELRVALEAGLYFDPELRPLLLERTDRRVLNPLVKPGPVEERLAHIQYESLLARDARALCRRVEEIRNKMYERLRVPSHLDSEARRAELARRLVAWKNLVQLRDVIEQPLDDYGSLGSLHGPLSYYLEAEPVDRKELQSVLSELYTKLYFQQLRIADNGVVPELDAALALTRRVWQRQAAGRPPEELVQRQQELEARARERERAERRDLARQRREALRELLDNSHKQMQQARRDGCQTAADAPADLEAHLSLLREVAQAALADPDLRAEFERQRPRLRRDLEQLAAALSRCPARPPDPWRAEWERTCLELTRSLQAELDNPKVLLTAGGG